jgi:hypothetical protein
VVAERRRGHVEVGLDVSRGGAVGPGLDHEPERAETYGVPERRELLGAFVEEGCHALVLIFSK